MKLRALILLPLLGTEVLSGQQFDFEPKVLLEGTGAAPLPGSQTLTPEERVEQCRTAVVQAEQRAADSEQLYKEGVLAKVEVETCFLRIVQRRKELADAVVGVAQARVDAVTKALNAHGATQADLDSANADLKAEEEAAATASVAWDKAQLDAAMLDLQRKRKLYSEGVGSRHDLQVAEDRVTLLSGTGAR
jgi:hypothetical protein